MEELSDWYGAKTQRLKAGLGDVHQGVLPGVGVQSACAGAIGLLSYLNTELCKGLEGHVALDKGAQKSLVDLNEAKITHGGGVQRTLRGGAKGPKKKWLPQPKGRKVSNKET